MDYSLGIHAVRSTVSVKFEKLIPKKFKNCNDFQKLIYRISYQESSRMKEKDPNSIVRNPSKNIFYSPNSMSKLLTKEHQKTFQYPFVPLLSCILKGNNYWLYDKISINQKTGPINICWISGRNVPLTHEIHLEISAHSSHSWLKLFQVSLRSSNRGSEFQI